MPSIYRTKDPDEHGYKTEPNTPTRQSPETKSTMATSKSDPTPFNASLGSPKQIYDDTTPKQPTHRNTGNRNSNSPSQQMTLNGTCSEPNRSGVKFIQDYIKPSSPVMLSSGILSHDNVPPASNSNCGPALTNGKLGSPRMQAANYASPAGKHIINGMKTPARSITWNQDVTREKMTFTMRREIDKAKEETELLNQLRNVRRLWGGDTLFV